MVLFKIVLLDYLHGITSEWRFAEECSLLLTLRWHLGYDFDAPTPDHSARRFERQGLVQKFFGQLIAVTLLKRQASSDSITVVGALIQPWTSLGNFWPQHKRHWR